MRALTDAERKVVNTAIRYLRSGENTLCCIALEDAAVDLGWKLKEASALVDLFRAATKPRRASPFWFGATWNSDNNARRLRALRAMLLRDDDKRAAALKEIRADNAATLKREAKGAA